MSIPNGWMELNIDPKNITGIYIKDNQIIILGNPKGRDHNCNFMGCRNEHVLMYGRIIKNGFGSEANK
jgi:hypothetical protein